MAAYISTHRFQVGLEDLTTLLKEPNPLTSSLSPSVMEALTPLGGLEGGYNSIDTCTCVHVATYSLHVHVAVMMMMNVLTSTVSVEIFAVFFSSPSPLSTKYQSHGCKFNVGMLLCRHWTCPVHLYSHGGRL